MNFIPKTRSVGLDALKTWAMADTISGLSPVRGRSLGWLWISWAKKNFCKTSMGEEQGARSEEGGGGRRGEDYGPREEEE